LPKRRWLPKKAFQKQLVAGFIRMAESLKRYTC